jgi:hypothetical protein
VIRFNFKCLLAFNQGYQDYLADITIMLETLNPDDFDPNLETLDTLIRSISFR